MSRMRHREVRDLSKVTLLVGGKPGIAFGSVSKFRWTASFKEGVWIQFNSWTHPLKLCESGRWLSLSEPQFSRL